MKNTEVKIHPSANVQTQNIGDGSVVWQYSIILPGARIGEGCNINAHTFIENDVVIGDNVTVKCGVYLWDGLRIGDGAFIGPNATFTNDRYPRSKQHLAGYPETVVESGASIGANATILPGIRIGQRAIVGAGAVVTRNVPANAIVTGNPATISGYVDTLLKPKSDLAAVEKNSGYVDLEVGSCRLYYLPLVTDLRGNLSVAEYEQHVPFKAERFFWVFGVPSREVRGEHAHKECHQYLIAVKGSISVVLDDGVSRRELVLDRPNLGLHIAPGVWGVQYKYSDDAVLFVLASDKYNPADYIRSYDEFKSYKAQEGVAS